jgi:thiopeptide-type bacteriocin biosynthesis protein
VLADLHAAIVAAVPAAPASAVDTLLDVLIDEGFLTTELHPPMTTSDPLQHLLDTAIQLGADRDPITAPLITELCASHDLLRQHAATTASRSALRSAARSRLRAAMGTDPTLSVDLRVDADVAMPRAVVVEAEKAAAALVRLSTIATAGHSRTAVWSDYLRRFLERYGIGAVVPLQELLHGAGGLGYPAGYRTSTLPMPPTRPHPGPQSQHGHALAAIAQTAAWERRREVVLTDRDVDTLADGVPVVPQPHTDLRVEVHAATRAQLDRGAFRLAVVGASRAAGTITGRFLDLLDPHDHDHLVAAYQQMPTATTGALRIQVSGPPANAAAHVIARSPRVLPDQLTVGDAAADAVPLSDIGVSADASGLYLLSLSRRRPVEPMAFTALELVRSAHPTLRFLCEIATAFCTPCAPFSWGDTARGLPFLPRLRHGRTVLSPARWTLAADDLTPAGFRDELAEWRDRWAVPDTVALQEHDRRLQLDLTEPAHQHVLQHTVTRRGRVILTEAPPPEAFGWIEGRAHELVLPLAATSSSSHPPRPRPTAPSAVSASPRHLPGAGDWLYAQLPCHPDQQTRILTTHLPRLLHDLARDPLWQQAQPEWWFLRHTDPDPHLRLRIRCPAPGMFAAAASRLAVWAETLMDAGLLGPLRLDTYLPETGRFGDGAVMRAAEVVFAADSAAAAAQLALSETGSAVMAASFIDITTSLAASPAEGLRWLVQHAPRAVAKAPSRDVRSCAIDLSAPHHRTLASIPCGDRVLAAWARRRRALAAYRAALIEGGVDPELVLPDLLHLHHARVVGPSLEGERACLHLARAAALSQLAGIGRAA